MLELFLSQQNNVKAHEEVEHILEGYRDGLHDLHLKTHGLLVQVVL